MKTYTDAQLDTIYTTEATKYAAYLKTIGATKHYIDMNGEERAAYRLAQELHSKK